MLLVARQHPLLNKPLLLDKPHSKSTPTVSIHDEEGDVPISVGTEDLVGLQLASEANMLSVWQQCLC